MPRSFSWKSWRICPSCLAAKKQTKFTRIIWFWAATIVVSLALLTDSKSRLWGFYFLNWILFDLCLMFTILPHELGHAAMAKLVGFRVFRVVAGSGKTFYMRRISEFVMELKRIPFSGATLMAPKEREGVRWKYALSIIGGPAVNFVLVLVVYAVAPRPFWPPTADSFSENPGRFFFELFGTQLLPVQLIVITNLYVMAYNLWPHLLRRPYGIIPSDGLALWRAMFMKEERVKELLASYYTGEANECYLNRRYAEAQNWAETGLKEFPGNEALTNFLGVALLEQRRYEEARKLFLKQIDPPTKNVVIHTFALNNLAYANVLAEDASLLDEAEKCSSLAMAKMAWNPAIKGTRGAVLVEMDRIQEGVKLLLEAVAGHEKTESKAINACFLAIGERRLGHAEAADSYLKMAEALDPTCPLLDRARRAV